MKERRKEPIFKPLLWHASPHLKCGSGWLVNVTSPFPG
jgi:hypothetical protein